MEREKRKEMSAEENGGVVEEMKRRKKKKKKIRKEEEEEEEEEKEAAGVEEPSTEEVEEFYAILRRMDVALRYLKGKRLPEKRTTTGETAVVGENKELNLNLNEVPSDSSN
uniref:Protein NIM1-INTERACTING 2-like n=1 Tax=Cucumis melo TaxID=3656 RepID=A0A9I9CDN8_CUCME